MLLAQTHPAFHRGAAPLALFDRMLESVTAPVAAGPRPVVYDLVQTGESTFRLDLPALGLGEDDIEIEAKDRNLVIKARDRARPEGETVLHAGIAAGVVERRFTLGAHLRVDGASLKNGVLQIALVREVPDALKPRTIAVTRAD